MFEQCYTTRGDFVPRTFGNVFKHLGCHTGEEDTLHNGNYLAQCQDGKVCQTTC